jgi:hypothetical protein
LTVDGVKPGRFTRPAYVTDTPAYIERFASYTVRS